MIASTGVDEDAQETGGGKGLVLCYDIDVLSRGVVAFGYYGSIQLIDDDERAHVH